ncbi:D-aminopeptidase [Thermoflexales bacterium]|nr:D-aminopeptidase [Thermoflexales bacterium]
MNNTITAVPGIRVGHAQNDEARTGCTVILCEGGAVGGVDQRGGAPGTRETDLLRPLHRVEQVHGVLLTGGSAFGLDATGGVMRYLEERGSGFDVGVARVPIVPAAVIFDLAIGRADVRPDADMAYQACLNATSDPVAEGNVGAGTGATVGKILGMQSAMNSGVGSACVEIIEGLFVGAIAVVNALGDVIDPQTGTIIAGARSEDGLADTLQVMRNFQALTSAFASNTIIGVVATNAKLNKEGANKMAQMAQAGLARTVRPAHTMYDGDTIFALSTGELQADVNLIGAFAAEVFAEAIVRGVRAATT